MLRIGSCMVHRRWRCREASRTRSIALILHYHLHWRTRPVFLDSRQDMQCIKRAISEQMLVNIWTAIAQIGQGDTSKVDGAVAASVKVCRSSCCTREAAKSDCSAFFRSGLCLKSGNEANEMDPDDRDVPLQGEQEGSTGSRKRRVTKTPREGFSRGILPRGYSDHLSRDLHLHQSGNIGGAVLAVCLRRSGVSSSVFVLASQWVCSCV